MWRRLWWRIRFEWDLLFAAGRKKWRRNLKELMFFQLYGGGSTGLRFPLWATPRIRRKLNYFPDSPTGRLEVYVPDSQWVRRDGEVGRKVIHFDDVDYAAIERRILETLRKKCSAEELARFKRYMGM